VPSPAVRRRLRNRLHILGVAALVAASVVKAGSASASPRRPTVWFRPVLAVLPPAAKAAHPAPSAAAAVASCRAAAVVTLDAVPTTRPADDDPAACVVLPDRKHGRAALRYYLGPAQVGAHDIARATSGREPGTGWVLTTYFANAGSAKWDAFAQSSFHARVALEADGVVWIAPTIQPDRLDFESFGGEVALSGGWSEHDVRALAALVNRARAE